MRNSLQTRILAIVLAVVTAAGCIFAGINLRREGAFDVPTDGVRWVEASGGIRAEHVPFDSPARRAGVRTGDLLIAVDDLPTPRLASLVREMFHVGIWARATYQIVRPPAHTDERLGPARLDVQVIFEPADRSMNNGMRAIALVYLGIGLYVLLRRWTAPKSIHFYIFCLVSFVLYSFKYTGQFDAFDWTIYWANITAGALQPALFLHFAIGFSTSAPKSRVQRVKGHFAAAALYLPGAALVWLQYTAIKIWSASERVHHRLDQVAVGYLALYYVVAATVFWFRYRLADSTLERQQLKWLSRGTLLAVTPFTFLYAIPYMADLAVPSALTKLAGLSLVFLPLTFSWAIVRYRLMDVDLIFKRGVSYTLATAALLGVYFGVVAMAAEVVHTRLPNLRIWGLIAAVIVTGLVFDPLKRAIQGRVDRIFEPKRFDYRETLVNFGRGLSSQTNLSMLLASIVERLPQTLLVTRVAVFVSENTVGSQPCFSLVASHGLSDVSTTDGKGLDLSFLSFDDPTANNHLFLENPQQALLLSVMGRQTAARLDLNYYLPCRVAHHEDGGTRTVAVLGIGRTSHGDFLSSEDVELLESLADYVGIAIQNAQLYKRLEQKISEFERLKEFHENIVESINVGVLAVDLDNRVESWNQQMEAMLGVPRSEAVHQNLADLFPVEFIERFKGIALDEGTHTLYKFRLILPNGQLRISNIAIAPLLSRNAKAIGRIILIDDITNRTELEEQLSQAEKLSSIGLLAAGVAHEVNTPLAVISSYAQMLTKQMSGDQKLAPVLEKITQQTFRASEIVNGLLNFSRTGAAEFSTLLINSVIQETLILLDHQMKTAQITVDVQLDHKLSPIYGNQGKLQQVLLNLLLNAKEAMARSPSARLKVSTYNHSGRVFVRIEDCGSGIRQDLLHRIYDPFFTTKTTPRLGEHKGTGLGLAVTYGIIQEHAGEIHVESTEGLGTTFLLDFPAMTGNTPDTHQTHSTPVERTTIHA